MRIGKIEGTPQELKDMLDDQGFNFEDYLGEPYSPPKKRWIVIPTMIIIILLTTIVVIGKTNVKVNSILFILCFLSGVWCTCSVAIILKNSVVTSIIAIGLLLLMLIIFGYIQPKDSIDILKVFSK